MVSTFCISTMLHCSMHPNWRNAVVRMVIRWCKGTEVTWMVRPVVQTFSAGSERVNVNAFRRGSCQSATTSRVVRKCLRIGDFTDCKQKLSPVIIAYFFSKFTHCRLQQYTSSYVCFLSEREESRQLLACNVTGLGAPPPFSQHTPHICTILCIHDKYMSISFPISRKFETFLCFQAQLSACTQDGPLAVQVGEGWSPRQGVPNHVRVLLQTCRHKVD